MTSPAVIGAAARVVGALLVTFALLLPSAALAQFGAGGPPKPPTPSKPQKKAAGGDTHAAPEDGQQQVQQPPTLPQNPLEVPPEVQKQIGSDADPDSKSQGEGAKSKLDFYGPYIQETNGKYRFRTVFPFWFERTQPDVGAPKPDPKDPSAKEAVDRASLYGLFYFNRRSTNHDADVVFPLFWRFRDYGVSTTLVGPFLHQETKAGVLDKNGKPSVGGHANWLFPLFFEGKSDDGKGYLHIPPLLTFMQHTDRSGLNIVGPVFCKWRGGPACDPRTSDVLDFGVAPFYFYGKNQTSEYEIIPPLLHYYKYNTVDDTYLNVWGPYVREKKKDSDFEAVAPFYFRSWAKNEDHLTVFPFFHYGYKGKSSLLITPLFANIVEENGDKTFISPLYARHRGRTELDMITPFFWHFKDPDAKLERTIVPPFFYRQVSPRGEDTIVFPFYGRFKREGLSDTIFITPLFRHTRDVTGWETDLYPFFYMGRHHKTSHFVIAPIVWDFAGPRSRSTVILPAFFRFEDDQGVSQLLLNTYYQERKVKNGKEYEFHFFPLFSFGESPTGHWWNILYGIAGFSRNGSASSMRVFYFPLELSR